MELTANEAEAYLHVVGGQLKRGVGEEKDFYIKYKDRSTHQLHINLRQYKTIVKGTIQHQKTPNKHTLNIENTLNISITLKKTQLN